MGKYDKIIDSVRAIVKKEQPAVDISEILLNHKCFYLLAVLTQISEKNKYAVTAANDMAYNKVLISERYKKCTPVFDAMQELPYAVIKGAVLSQAAYGDITYRKSGDIDLLVSRSHVDKLINIMRNNEFIQGKITDEGIKPFTRQEILFHSSLSHQTAPFVKKTNNILCPYIEVDINMDTIWGESKIKADMDYILSNTVPVNICGVTTYKLNTAIEFISLCLHHYKDMNSIYLLSCGSLKLSLFCDIYFYLINNNVDIAELITECNKLNISEYVYYCIYYTNLIFSDVRLDAYLPALENKKDKNIIDTFGLADDERKNWNISFYERLFSKYFYEEFTKQLSEKDKAKIRHNHTFM